MNLIPTIQLQNGYCVTLHRGRVEEPSIWHVDPVVKAREFSDAGAEWLQVTDLDPVTGDGDNAAIIEDIINRGGASVQVAGGIATKERVAHWMDKGAGRVVFGSAALTNPDFVKEAAKYYPDQIVLAVDVYEGRVSANGWRDTSAFEPGAFIDEFQNEPLAAISITDIHSDIGDTDRSIGVVSGLAENLRTPVFAGGLVCDVDDVARLKYVHNIAAVLIGRSLFEHTLDLNEALALATRTLDEKVAAFL